MADNTLQNGTANMASDELVTAVNGVATASPFPHAQRIKLDAKGIDGSHTDISPKDPLPIAASGLNQTYRLFVPKQAVGASKVYFDLFNATGSGKTLRVLSIVPVVSGEVAVTGVIAVDLFLTRTSAIGTGGTAATADGAVLTAATISKMDPANAALPAGVTARLTPAGGATAGAVISQESVFTEETNAATYQSTLFDFIRRIAGVGAPCLIVPENTGIRVVQGAVAGVGNIGFDVLFELV